MKKLSIVLGFRDRDIVRVKKCLDSLAAQAFTDFSVVFVDYGSLPETARLAEATVAAYPFAKYVYSHTRGMVWNRSRALNTGLHFTDAPYILFGDIDLIYSADFLQSAMAHAAPERLVCAPMHFLPKKLPALTKTQLATQKLPISEAPIGAILLLSRQTIEALNGFDEYYCIWGVEDRDLVSRLRRINVEIFVMQADNSPVFHQWHPIASDQKRNFFPDRWWDTMNIYYQSQINAVRRNPKGMGKIFTEKDRPVFSAAVNEFTFPTKGNSYTKGQVICSLVQAITNLSSHATARPTRSYVFPPHQPAAR
jgi:Predicted glycosyltransferases